MRCPHCYSSQLYQSRRGTALLPWPFRWLMVSIRCYKCYSRFFQRHQLLGGAEVRKPPSQVSFN